MVIPRVATPDGVATLDCTHENAIARAVEALRLDGVVLLQQAIANPLLGDLQAMVDEWYSRFLAGNVQNYSLGDETATIVPELWADAFTKPRDVQSFRKWNVAALDHRIVPLVDSTPLYDVVYSFIGPDLMVTKTQMIVVPTHCRDSPYLHTDAGSMSDVIESMDASPLMVSAQLFLSDLPAKDMGNFTCVPGSHTKRFPWDNDNPDRSQLVTSPLGCSVPIEQRHQVLVRGGDIVLFSHALWHGVSVNKSFHDRKSVILSYAKSFVRPYDYEHIPQPVLERGSLRQRLLFGDLGGWAWRPGCYYHIPRDYLDALRSDAADRDL